MLSMLVLCAGIVVISYAFYKWTTKHYDYFEKRNMPYIKPTFLMGTMGGVMMGMHHIDEWTKWLHNACPAKYVQLIIYCYSVT